MHHNNKAMVPGPGDSVTKEDIADVLYGCRNSHAAS
jgi:hypothetical protein